VFAWVRSDGTNLRVQARARTAAGVKSPVQTLSLVGQDASAPQVGVAADGDAVFTWARLKGKSWRIQARARSAAGVLSPVQTLSGPGGASPQVGVDADGDPRFTWSRFEPMGTRVQAAAGLSAPEFLSAAGQDADDPQIAVDDDGDAVVTWERFDGTTLRVQAAVGP
jgi:hypothetical protein